MQGSWIAGWGAGIGPEAGLSLGLVALVFLLAGLVKGLVGLGLPTVTVGLLALWMPPAGAAALVAVPALLTNLWQWQPWRGLGGLGARLVQMQLALVVGTLGTLALLGAPRGALATQALGLALLLYALWGLAARSWRLAPRWEPLAAPLAGLLTGLTTATTGVSVLPSVPYLQALGLRPAALMRAMGMSFCMATLALAVGLHRDAALPPATLLTSGLMLAPALAGMALGQHLAARWSPAGFRRALMIGLGGLGLAMLVR